MLLIGKPVNNLYKIYKSMGHGFHGELLNNQRVNMYTVYLYRYGSGIRSAEELLAQGLDIMTDVPRLTFEPWHRTTREQRWDAVARYGPIWPDGHHWVWFIIGLTMSHISRGNSF